MTVITSYAQNFEDVMLWRALGHIQNGRYIDIGAQDPVVDSVSMAFHEHGWKGIHIEPTPHYAELLRQQRPGDEIIQAAISTEPGVIKFFEIPETGISTGDPVIAQQHRDRGFDVREIAVVSLTLNAIFDSNKETEFHWLKIDVEGFERQVLTSWAPSVVRPWVVVVESTLPLTQIDTHETWEPILLNYGYSQVYFDGLNRYYVSNAHPELCAAFLSPPNVFDGFSLNGTASNPMHHVIVARYNQQISNLAVKNTEQELLSTNEIDRLNKDLVELNHEHVSLKQASDWRQTEIENKLQVLQQQSTVEKLELIRQHQEVVHDMERLKVGQDRLYSERIFSLGQELNELRSEFAMQGKICAEKTEAQTQELISLLKFQEQREHDVAEQISAIHKQAYSQRVEQDQMSAARISELNQEMRDLQTDYAAREQIRTEKDAAKTREIVNLLQSHAERERTAAEQVQVIQEQAYAQHVDQERLNAQQVSNLNQKLYDLNTNYAVREQEFAEKTKELQQHAELGKIELIKLHHEQSQALRSKLCEREHILGHEISLLQKQTIALQHEQQMLQQRHEFEISRNFENHNLLIETCGILEQQLRSELQLERQISAQLKHVLTEVQNNLQFTHESFSWRLTSPLRKLASILFPETKVVNDSSFSQGKINSILQIALENLPIKIPHTFNESAMNSTAPTIDPQTSTIANSLDELLSYNDYHFICCAYQTLLGRAADVIGTEYYLMRLRNGISKIQIVTQMRVSKEGKAFKVDLIGLNSEIRRYQRGQYLVVGWLFRLFGGIEGNNPIERKLRVIELQLYLLSDASRRRFDQMESAITNFEQMARHPAEKAVKENEESQPIFTEVNAKVVGSPTEPEGFGLLTKRAQEIFMQLKSTKVLNSGNEA